MVNRKKRDEQRIHPETATGVGPTTRTVSGCGFPAERGNSGGTSLPEDSAVPFIDIHTHDAEQQPGTIRLYSARPGELLDNISPCSAGIHPWDTGNASASQIRWLENHIGHLSAVGEIGLDYARVPPERQVQESWLRRQLELAESFGKPVILHCVRAYPDIRTVLRDYRLPAVIFHGFTGSAQTAGELTGDGHYLSFGWRTFRSPKTVEAIRNVPSDYLFLESDESDRSIPELYRETAALRKEEIGALKQQTYRNYVKIVGR